MVAERSQNAIETFSLTKVFPDWWGRAKVIAVDNLNLKIKHNEIYGLLGPNGSGKTTTLKILLNLLYPTKGKAILLGGSGGDPKITKRIGYLPEDSYLYRYLSARESLDFYGRIFSLPKRVRKARIDALLDMVGLTGMANRAVGTFSKGMMRRIGLAQALINDPELLILDEPTSGMDPISTRQMKDLLIKLAERGKTILLCSHLLADVEDVCDRIGILYGGRMQVEGKVDSLLQQCNETQILTGNISDSAIEKIKQIVATEKLECQITTPMDKLEDFFINTVAHAEREKQPTSGAVGSTAIGGFLKDNDDTGPGILEKLTSAGLSDGAEKAEAETIAAPPPESVESKPKTDLLENLKQKAEQATTETVQTRQVTPSPISVDKDDEVKRNVLDQLVDDQYGPDKETGEAENA